MYKYNKPRKTTLVVNNSYEGETIEQKVERFTNNNEPIKDGAPLIYTDRKDGVQAGYNIKTDRFEVAIDAMDKIQKTKIAEREKRAEMRVIKDGGAESNSGTDGTNN
jgi:hypothetical protein